MAEREYQPDKIRHLEQQIQDYESLNKALERISSSISVEDAIYYILEQALQLCGAEQGAIILFGPHGHQDTRTLIREGLASEELLDHALNQILGGRALVEKKPLVTDNPQEKLKGLKEKYARITSLLSVLITLQEEMTGVINLITTHPQKRFSERELRLLTLLSNQCAHFIHKTEMYEALQTEAARLKTEVQGKFAFHGTISHSPKMQKVFSLLESVFPTDVRVLIEGASGSGKERIARVIHYNGPRKDRAFVAIDCGALPASLLESELFGYVKGAFTGANQDRQGLFEEADGGTLFLDEIGNMPLEIQAKLLRALQEGEIRPLGSSQVKKVDVRIIAATNEDLPARIKAGEFRQDLFFRLNVVNIALPPLRERKEDIPVLADHFLRQKSTKYGKQLEGFQPEAMAALEKYAWPGNIRELENAVERAVVLCKSGQLSKADFPFLSAPQVFVNEIFEPQPWEAAIQVYKRGYLLKVLEHTGGMKKKAAELLQIQQSYLSRLLKNLQIDD